MEKPNQFRDISTDQTLNNVPTFCSFKTVTEDDVRKQVKGMKIKTCPRDPIPASLLKTSIDSIIPCYVEIVNWFH